MPSLAFVLAAAILAVAAPVESLCPIPQAPQFPDPPMAVTHTAVSSGFWDQATTWSQGVPGNGAIVEIPSGITVALRTQESSQLDFVRVDGGLYFDETTDTRLEVETLYVGSTGALAIGSATSPVQAGRTAEILLLGPPTAIDLNWDPNQLSRGLVSDGSLQIFGQPHTHLATLASGASASATSLTLSGSAPADWQAGDTLVVAGTTFQRDAPFEDEVVQVRGVSGALVTLMQPLAHDHLPVDASMKIHVAHLTRNVIVHSQSTQVPQRGHVMSRDAKVDIEYALFQDLGRTDKRIPLDDVTVNAFYKSDGSVSSYTVTPTPTASIQNRRGRYALHFHQNGVQPGSAPPSRVYGCVVRGTPGWGYVNHGSHVDFRNNICRDFAGAGFVTEGGNELGNFFNNVAIHGTGVPGSTPGQTEYFPIRVVFHNQDRPQPLSDFAFGGDGFWFQGPAIRARDNVANSCSGAGMFWYTTGAVNVDDNQYYGFPTKDILPVYGATISTRTWTHAPLEAVISDLPILEMDGFDGYACLDGFRLRFCNAGANPAYSEFFYDRYLQGSASYLQQEVHNLRLWNNEQAFRVRYNRETKWVDVTAANALRYDNKNKFYAGAEFYHQANAQEFQDLSISGYGIAGWIHKDNEDNTGQVTFLNSPIYADYANPDTYVSPDGLPVSNLQAGNPTTSSFDLTWSSFTSSNPDRFLVRYRPLGTVVWSYHTEANGIATSTTLTGLLSGTTYEYQVMVGWPNTVSHWSDPHNNTFTTL